jgi:3-methyladenine DNA glycosylase/8-oxoguanine DNA glycosylase
MVTQRVTENQNRVNIADRMWARLLSSTGQPAFIDAEKHLSKKETKLQPTNVDASDDKNKDVETATENKAETGAMDETKTENEATNGAIPFNESAVPEPTKSE